MIRVYVVPPHPSSTNLRLRWQQGRKWKERSARTSDQKKAEKAAAILEADLNAGRFVATERLTWSAFCLRYENEHLASLSIGSLKAWVSCRNHVNRLMAWKYLDEATSDAISTFKGELRKQRVGKAKIKDDRHRNRPRSKRAGKPVSETTIGTHLTQLRTALNWAHDMRLLAVRVTISIPRSAKKDTQMRGRPITLKEFKLLLRATRDVCPHNAQELRRLMRGLFLSGMRLGEGVTISWDDSAPFAVDLTGKHPRFRIWSEGEKGRKDRYLPMTPDFAKWLLRTPENQRQGLVFPLTIKSGKRRNSRMEAASKLISRAGEQAGIVVDPALGTCATAHDLRRSFGTRWSNKVKPVVLQQLMRHADLSTTMKYYVAQDADDIATGLWEDHG